MKKTDDQIIEWLKKLERESWQLELLVSAFTIFLLIQAVSSFDGFIESIQYEYNLSSGILPLLFVFLILIQNSLKALTVCLVIHLMLRGFWIGTIGLRSVQSTIDFKKLNYNDFFTDKLKKRVISLDQLVIKLDEICSVIFAFSFLIISILMAFGLYLVFISGLGVAFSALVNAVSGWLQAVVLVIAISLILVILLFGLLYMIDYFTLGFFKKVRWFAKIYYPFYRLFNFITLSALSRSIYYYLISKFSKKNIRVVYGLVGLITLFFILFSFDQYQYFPKEKSKHQLIANQYDDERPADSYISRASIASRFIKGDYLPVYLRYDPSDNEILRQHCDDFEPMRSDGINWRFEVRRDGANFNVGSADYSEEDTQAMVACHGSLYQLHLNDQLLDSISYFFYTHPAKEQKGLSSVLPSEDFRPGYNELIIKKLSKDEEGELVYNDFATIPFWFSRD